MVPTVLDALGVEPPAAIRGVAQTPLEGVSFAHTFDDADAPSAHVTQYFEMFGHRAIYHDGWRAVCPWPAPNFTAAAQTRPQAGAADHAGDPRGARPQRLGALPDGRRSDRVARLAAEHPDTLRELVALLVAGGREVQGPAARRLDAGAAGDGAAADVQAAHALRLLPGRLGRPGLRGAAGSTTAPHSIEADVDIPAGGAEGVLVAQGGDAGGYALLREGRAAVLRLQLRRPRPLRAAGRGRAQPRAATRCATSSSPPARRTSPTARASRDAGSCTSTASSSPTPSTRTRRRCCSSSRG